MVHSERDTSFSVTHPQSISFNTVPSQQILDKYYTFQVPDLILDADDDENDMEWRGNVDVKNLYKWIQLEAVPKEELEEQVPTSSPIPQALTGGCHCRNGCKRKLPIQTP